MADFGKRSQGGESLDAIARTDQLLDAIATERRVPPADAGEAELFALLGEWRDEVRWPPATDLVTERDAAAALRDGVNSIPAKRGGHRGLTIVASLAAAVLCIGGFGAVVSGAGPGDPLYGLRTTLLGEPQQVRDDRVALAAKSEMEQVQTLIDNGDWQQAQQKLATVSSSVQSVDDTGTKQQLIDQWNQLAVKVDQQDPAATVPPSAAPGPLEQLTLPSELPQISLPETLPPGLPSLPETLPSMPDFSLPETLPSFTLPSSLPSLFPSPPGSASAGPAPQQTVSAPPTVVTTTTGPAATAAPTSTAPTSASSAPTSESSSPTSATQSQAPQVVTTTTTTTTTTAAAPASTPAPAPSSDVTTTTTTAAATAPRAAESQTVEAPAAPTVAQTAPQRAPDVVTTTTTPRPILQLPILGGN